MFARSLVALLAFLFAAPLAGAGDAEATLLIANRPVMVFRGPFMGASPAIRAARAQAVIGNTLKQGGAPTVAVKPHLEELLVLIDDRLAFVVTPGDLDPAQVGRLEDLAAQAARNLEQVVAETREARSLRALLKAIGASVAATLAFFLLLKALVALRERALRALAAQAERKSLSLRIAGLQLLEGQSPMRFLRIAVEVFRWHMVGLLAYEWLGFVLSRFPFTRPWSERLNGYVFGMLGHLFRGIAGALPGLGFALAIFLLAHLATRAMGRLFLRISLAEAPPHWLSPETETTTRRLATVLIWLFALAIAYPYLPGSQSEAFKGLSVLLGLMISLGSSSIVGQGAAGLILTYTRTLRPGEYVRIGEHEGTVMEMGIFTTRVQTGLGEELTLPNSLIAAAVTKNYSRIVQGRGYVLDTTVTIGYDTPWRQVEAMLVEAARRTPGILPTPAPQVFQTALSDYYPEYRLVAQAIPSRPRPRAEVLNELHANIQDVFNEYGVQIMSPHYLGDPLQPKVVPPEAWYPAPSRREDLPPA